MYYTPQRKDRKNYSDSVFGTRVQRKILNNSGRVEAVPGNDEYFVDGDCEVLSNVAQIRKLPTELRCAMCFDSNGRKIGVLAHNVISGRKQIIRIRFWNYVRLSDPFVYNSCLQVIYWSKKSFARSSYDETDWSMVITLSVLRNQKHGFFFFYKNVRISICVRVFLCTYPRATQFQIL